MANSKIANINDINALVYKDSYNNVSKPKCPTYSELTKIKALKIAGSYGDKQLVPLDSISLDKSKLFLIDINAKKANIMVSLGENIVINLTPILGSTASSYFSVQISVEVALGGYIVSNSRENYGSKSFTKSCELLNILRTDILTINPDTYDISSNVKTIIAFTVSGGSTRPTT